MVLLAFSVNLKSFRHVELLVFRLTHSHTAGMASGNTFAELLGFWGFTSFDLLSL